MTTPTIILNLNLFFVLHQHLTAMVILLWVVYGWRKPVHTSWSTFCTVNHRASASNYKLSNMKCPGRDSNRQPQRLKVCTRTATPPNPLTIILNIQLHLATGWCLHFNYQLISKLFSIYSTFWRELLCNFSRIILYIQGGSH